MEFRRSFDNDLPKNHNPTSTSSLDDISEQRDSSLSSNVSSLTHDIYRECKSLVATYGDKFLHNLMPLIVTALENLDSLHAEKEEMLLKLAVFKEDHRLLMNEYEREKSNRKLAEAKNLKLEDDIDEEKKLFQTRLTELEASLRVTELKLRNSTEQIARAEERENEWAKKYHDLHDRYTGLIKSYVEYVERARSSCKIDPHSSGTDAYVPSVSSLHPPALSGYEEGYHKTGIPQFDSGVDYQRAISKSQFDLLQAQAFEAERQRIMRNILESTPELQDSDTLRGNLPDPSFDELSQTDLLSEDGIDAQSYDGSTCNQQTNGGDSSSLDIFNGVTREVNNLIKENQDLVQTKNALNVVTNDLIGRIDDLTCENLRLSSERNALVNNSTTMLLRIKDLEQECRRLRHELESIDLRDSMYTGSLRSGDSCEDSEDSDTPLATRKRFSRIEMARVLLERNQYKEQLFELQDAIRWTGTLRAEQLERQHSRRLGRREPRKRGRLWNLFAKLFTSKNQENEPVSSSRAQSSSVVYQVGSGGGHLANSTGRSRPPPNTDSRRAPRDCSQSSTTETQSPGSNSRPIAASRPAHRPPRKSVRRLGPTEWLPLSKPVVPVHATDFPELLRHGSSYPYTCYVRPVCEKLTGFKLWCAACVYKSSPPDAMTISSVSESRGNCQPKHRTPASERLFGSALDTSYSNTTPLRPTGDEVAPVDSSSPLPLRSGSTMDITTSESWKSTSPDSNLSNLIWICSVTVGCGVPLKQLVNSTPNGHHHHDGDRSDGGMVHSLITVINVDEPQRNLDAFVVTASTVLCMAAVPGCSTDDLHQLKQTAGWWNSVPLNLSEELLFDDSALRSNVQAGPYRSLFSPAYTGAALVTPTAPADCTNGVPRQSVGYPGALHSHSCQTSYRPWGMWDDPGSMHMSTSSMPPTCRDQTASSSETMVSYFIERKRFLVRNMSGYTASEALRTRRYGSVTSVGQSKPDMPAECPSSSDTKQLPSKRVTSAQPTVWLGCYNGDVFVHSSVANWHGCMHAIRLPDSVIQIQHFNSRVFVSLANGQLVVFRRCLAPNYDSPDSLSALSLNAAVTSSNSHEPAESTPPATCTNRSPPVSAVNRESANNTTRVGTWDFTEACVITCGNCRTPVRRTVVIPPANTVWTTHRNQILVIDALTLQLVNCFEVHPRRDAQIQSMCWFADGVWIAVRKDPSLRLYHAHTHQLLQSVDLGSILLKWLPILRAVPSNASSSRSRKSASAMTTALFASSEHLWIGTNVGLVITVPFGPSSAPSSTSDSNEPDSSPSSYQSKVNVSGMQVSRNEHSGPVRFFVTARGSGVIQPSRGDPACGSVSDEQRTANRVDQQAHSWCAPSPHQTPHDSQVLVLSGGEGYKILDPTNTEQQSTTGGADVLTDQSVDNSPTCPFSRVRNHLIVWKLDSQEERLSNGC